MDHLLYYDQCLQCFYILSTMLTSKLQHHRAYGMDHLLCYTQCILSRCTQCPQCDIDRLLCDTQCILSHCTQCTQCPQCDMDRLLCYTQCHQCVRSLLLTRSTSKPQHHRVYDTDHPHCSAKCGTDLLSLCAQRLLFLQQGMPHHSSCRQLLTISKSMCVPQLPKVSDLQGAAKTNGLQEGVK